MRVINRVYTAKKSTVMSQAEEVILLCKECSHHRFTPWGQLTVVSGTSKGGIGYVCMKLGAKPSSVHPRFRHENLGQAGFQIQKQPSLSPRIEGEETPALCLGH